MKTLELKLKKRILLVEASNEVALIGFEYGGAKLELLGKLSDLKEIHFVPLVESELNYEPWELHGGETFYKDYRKKNEWLRNAKDAFESAVNSVGYYLKPKLGHVGLLLEQTFNPETTYLFEILEIKK